MSALLTPPVPVRTPPQARTYTLAEYQALIDTGVIREGERVELIDGHLVYPIPANPPHAAATAKLNRRLILLSPDGYVVRCQSDAIVGTSRAEPDVCVARGAESAFDFRHPEPADIALVVEVSDSSLVFDRGDKLRVYARAAIPVYWIVNVADRQIEVYTNPDATANPPAYATRTDYAIADAVPIALDGQPVATVPVADLIA